MEKGFEIYTNHTKTLEQIGFIEGCLGAFDRDFLNHKNIVRERLKHILYTKFTEHILNVLPEEVGSLEVVEGCKAFRENFDQIEEDLEDWSQDNLFNYLNGMKREVGLY